MNPKKQVYGLLTKVSCVKKLGMECDGKIKTLGIYIKPENT